MKSKKGFRLSQLNSLYLLKEMYPRLSQEQKSIPSDGLNSIITAILIVFDIYVILKVIPNVVLGINESIQTAMASS